MLFLRIERVACPLQLAAERKRYMEHSMAEAEIIRE